MTTPPLSRIPWLLFISSLAITLLGLCGLLRADELYGRTMLVERQMIWLLLALPVCALVAMTPFRLIRPWSMPLFVLSLGLLAVTLLMPPVNGSRRWIPLGFFDLQASEPARMTFVLALAMWLMHRRTQQTVSGLLVPALMAIIPMLLIIREPDLDTALLFVPVLLVMLLSAGANVRHLGNATLVLIAFIPLLWTQMSAEQKSRIVTVFTQQDGGRTPTGDGFHLHQSKQVLALGGFYGSITEPVPPVDDPAAWQLPASRTDFVFVMIGERLGFAGCATLMICYCMLIFQALSIAQSAQEPWARLVAIGITTLIAEQAILNTAMTVGILPITGTTLPLCSYGGSSLISTWAGIGLLMSIRMHSAPEATGEPFFFRSLHPTR